MRGLYRHSFEKFPIRISVLTYKIQNGAENIFLSIVQAVTEVFCHT